MAIRASRLRKILEYDPNSGIFLRKKNGLVAGTKHCRGYWQVCVDNKIYLAHRLAWFYTYGNWPTQLDHINRNKLDNRISNLREANQSQNLANASLSKINTSGFKGVCWDKITKSWMASIRKDYKRINLGRFKKKKDAHTAYVTAANKYFGEYSYSP